MTPSRFECQLCQFETNCVKSIRSHITTNHGDFHCKRCGDRVNLKHLFKHEVAHLKSDIKNGLVKYGTWTLTCCYCGRRRDNTGFHYCDKNFLHYKFLKLTAKHSTGKYKNPKFTFSERMLNPYTNKSREIIETEVNNKKYKLEYTGICPRNPDAVALLSNRKLLKTGEDKLRSMKKHRFQPKLPAQFDSDSDDDDDSDASCC